MRKRHNKQWLSTEALFLRTSQYKPDYQPKQAHSLAPFLDSRSRYTCNWVSFANFRTIDMCSNDNWGDITGHCGAFSTTKCDIASAQKDSKHAKGVRKFFCSVLRSNVLRGAACPWGRTRATRSGNPLAEDTQRGRKEEKHRPRPWLLVTSQTTWIHVPALADTDSSKARVRARLALSKNANKERGIR